MTAVIVLPSIWPPYTLDCLATLDFSLADRVLVVDNTEVNRGVPVSWNMGVERAEAEGADWVWLLSAAVRFGQSGGLDFLDSLDDHPDALAVEAHPHFGWHCIAIATRAFAKVGRFDVNFWPGYWEDNDWSHRARCAYDLDPSPPGYWTKVPLDATDQGWGHAVELAGVVASPLALRSYYVRKWGAMSPDERWTRPFGTFPVDYQAPLFGAALRAAEAVEAAV